MERRKSISIVLILAMGGLVGAFTPLYFIANSNLNSLLVEQQNLSNELDDLWDIYQDLVNNYDNLLSNYQILSGDFDDLWNDFQTLNIEYNNLSDDNQELYNMLQLLNDTYFELLKDYQSLQSKYDTLVDFISQQILPVQYSTFSEAVRRYYLPYYLNDSSEKDWYMGFAEYCRDVILHDSFQGNMFINVSNAFTDILKFGNDTMSLADYIMYYTFWDWLPNWGGLDLTGNEFTDINKINQWCIDEIDYEYDSTIIYGQDSPTWDYPKFSVETAFRTMGDCEDQAILAAAYLESCGFDTAFVGHHDPAHPTIGALYHGSLLVHIEDVDTFWSLFPSAYLWTFGSLDPYFPNYTWCWLDPTWDVPFGTTPAWLQDYIDYGVPLSSDIISIAICDIGGTVF
ncbi:MAG: transglutaminase domain-containing protein [Promethearchaeota archaeon]